jgi:colanic acid/amylovoran biosynthesis glycosyltransferase
MKKVFVYRNELLPVSETFIQAQSAALRGFEVKLVGLKKAANSLTVKNDPIYLTTDNSFVSRLRRYVFMNTGLAPGWLNTLRAAKPDLVHCHFATDGAIAMQVADATDVPLICTLHGYDVTTKDEHLAKSLLGRIYLRRREKLWKRVAKFVPTSQYIRDRAVAAGFPAEKMQVLYSGLDLSRFEARDVPRNPNLVLYVGRLVEKKGGPYLLKAVAKVAETHPDVELVIIGDGPLRESLEAEAKALKINCRFLGRLMNPEPGNSVHDWMRKARVFCGPSVEAADGNTEGVPFVFVESHALGLPAVSFNHAGIQEAVLHGETGLLAPERDLETLAAYLLRMIEDDAFWEECSARGKSWVWERFDLNVLTGELESLYSSVIANGR